MTFKTPSPTVYFGSLLIAAPIAGLAYWILQTQQMTGNSLVILGTGLFIGHLIATFTQSPAAQSVQNKPTTKHAKQASSANPSDDTISLYVGNLAYRAQREDLHALFAQYGRVDSVRIMSDRTTRRPRGYAFIEMESTGAREALRQLDNTEFCERNLRVSEAKQRQ